MATNERMASNERVAANRSPLRADDPISWRAARAGTDVFAADGEPAGRLRRVEGDGAADIFHGLVVDVGDRAVLIPAAAVATITAARIDITMPAAAVAGLERFTRAGASAHPAGEREAPGTREPPAV
jgi:hypothetical protein